MNPCRSAIVLFLVLSLAGAAMGAKEAAGKGKAKKATPLIGVVVSVDGSSVKVKPKGKDAAELVIATDGNTVVELNGKAGKVADLAAGHRVKVYPPTGIAQRIVATSPKTKPAAPEKAK